MSDAGALEPDEATVLLRPPRSAARQYLASLMLTYDPVGLERERRLRMLAVRARRALAALASAISAALQWADEERAATQMLIRSALAVVVTAERHLRLRRRARSAARYEPGL